MFSDVSIATLSAREIGARVEELGALLSACVLDGASIGFVLPFGREESEAFWLDKVLPGVRDGTRVLLIAEQDGRTVGSAQLGCDTPANQPHRADVSKVLVHPDFRRRGIARALMAEIERHAADRGRSLLTLDTRTGDSAEPLYLSMGYRTVGVIPGYCLDVEKRRLDSTTVMYKAL
jgi:ribosomal protein S18 acetylase RimI-like enzyme